MIALQSGTSPRRARRFSTGHGAACPDIRHSSQIVLQLIRCDAGCRPFVSRFTLSKLAGPAGPQSHGILLARHIRSEPKPSGIEVLAFRDLQQLRGFLIDIREIFQHMERLFEQLQIIVRP